MSMRRHLAVALIVVACIVAAAVVISRIVAPPGGAGRIVPVDNRDFFGAAHGLLNSAEESIDVILYQSRFYFHYPLSASNTLLADLVTASERGARVRVVIEQASWNPENSEENRDVWNVLRRSDLELYFDPPEVTSHSKLVIVDGRYTLVGSSNWSHYSLDSNTEANVLIESKRVAAAFTDYFDAIVAQSSRHYGAVGRPVAALDLADWEERYALVRNVVDSSYYDPRGMEGRLYMDGVTVRVMDRALEEILAVDSLFFAHAPGETLRALVRVDREERSVVRAADVESGSTLEVMGRAFDLEKAEIARTRPPELDLDWMEAARVTPVPNEKYAKDVGKLIRKAEKRIWLALLDARYYEGTPETARKQHSAEDPPSLTNVMLADLIAAAARGVDVRLACDMGWSGSPPPTKIDFLRRLSAGGAKVFEDSADVTTHAKVGIVDDDWVVVGSTNWSYHALEENNETAVIVESRELNSHYASFVEGVICAGKPVFP